MKKLSNINLSKAIRSLVISSAFVAFLLFASSVQAANNGVKPEPPVEIKYLGSLDEKPVFQINFNNEDGEKAYLSLRDENGNIIYSELVKEKNYSRKIQLDNLELNNVKVTLSIRSKKENLTQAFQINHSLRTEENVEVAKLK